MRASALIAIALAALGCEDGARFTSGLGEPIRVANAQFIEGEIPADQGGPKILTIDSQNNAVVQGEVGKKLAGDAEGSTAAVALRLHGLGTGFWTLPAGAPDPQSPGALGWDATIDFSRSMPVGMRDLDIVAVGGDGKYGPPNPLPLTVLSLTPSGAAVITLRWDADADLDLHVIAPNGKEAYPKQMSTALDAGADPPEPGSGVLDRDSNGGCTIDGYRQEDLVFADAPAPGTYVIRVDMWSACSAPATTFTVDVVKGGATVLHQAGRLLDIDADGGGAGSGLFVAEVSL